MPAALILRWRLPDSNTADAVVAGVIAPAGSIGFTPVLGVERQGIKSALKVTGWEGPGAVPPATGYLAADGSIVATFGEAEDIAGGSAKAVLIAGGLLSSDATDQDYLDLLQQPANEAGDTVLEQIAAAGAAVTGTGGTIDVREDAALAAVASAESAVVGVGGTIDVREDTALAAIASREGQAINPAGAIDVREDAALAAIAAAEDAILDPVTGTLPVATALRIAEILATPGFDTLYPNAYATALPRGVTSGTIGGTSITGATPGTYALTPVGGSITGVEANLVVASATSASIVIVNPGLGSGTTPPTWANPAGATIPVGTTLTAVVAPRVATTGRYLALSSDGLSLQGYQNDGTSTPAALSGVALRTKAFVDAVVNVSNNTRSGYWGGIISANGHVGLAFRSTDSRPIFGYGGDVVARIEGVEGSISQTAAGRSGILSGVRTPSGLMPFFVDAFTGRGWVSGRDVVADIDAIQTVVDGLSDGGLADFPALSVSAFGNSLTAAGSSGSWVTKLAALIGHDVYDGGVGGQGALGIAARHGALPALATLTGNAVPASGAVTLTDIVGSPCTVSTSRTVSIGGVLGTLTRDAGSGHTFTRSSAGSSVTVTARTPVTDYEGAVYRDRIGIFEIGRNSFYSGAAEPMGLPALLSSYRAMIDYMTPRVKRVIIWETPPSTADSSPTRSTLTSVNAGIAAAFPENYLGMATWLRTTAPQTIGALTVNDPFTATGLSPTSQDLIDIAAGDTPTSFRSDTIHFNSNGGTAIAYRFHTELKMKGWA